MAVKRIAINGFGRIGRYLTRILANSTDIEIAVINARGDNESLAHLLKYDSTHRLCPFYVEVVEDGIELNGNFIRITRDPIGEWKWEDHGIDLVIETTGKLKTKEANLAHIACGAKKVIVSAPASKADLTVVMGVNDKEYDPEIHHIISAASCTTNCLAPAAMVLDKAFGVERGLMTTIHSYTMSQRILDGTHKDLRRARACAVSMIPTSTGAAKALGLVYPKLKGKVDGMAIRVPTPNVSLVDFSCTLEKKTTAKEINEVFRLAAEGDLRNYFGYTEEPLVSVDFHGISKGGILDSKLTSVIDNNFAKIIVWYDNETSFTHQLTRVIRMVANSMD